MKNRHKNLTKLKIPKYKYIIATMLAAFFIILPFVSYLKIINLDEVSAGVFPNKLGVYVDFFIYYKEILIILMALVCLLFFIGERIFPDVKERMYPLKDKNNKTVIICVIIYIVTVIISYIFSVNKELSFMGSPLDGEGVLVLVSYMILFLACMNYFCLEKSYNIIKKSIIIICTIIISLSLIEFLYKPLFEIQFFRTLIGPSEYSSIIDSMKNDGFKDMVALTMYNPNYYGGLCALLCPIAFCMWIKEKRNVKKFLLSLVSIGMMLCVFLSKSTAPIYTLVISILILIIIFRRNLVSNKIDVIKYVILSIGIVFIINIVSDNKLIEVMSKGLKNTPSIVNEKDKFMLKDIIFENKTLVIKGEEESLSIFIESKKDDDFNNFKFYDSNNIELAPIINGNIIKFHDNRFKAITIEDLGYGIVVDIGYNDTMNFYVKEDGFKGVGQNGKEIDTVKLEKPFLTNLYSLATGRGYTWVNTLPILKETILFGKGPGTFALSIQQDDYIGLMNTHGSAKFVIDKPHNMYLQVATQTGVIGLIALLIIFFITVKGYLIKIIKNEKTDEVDIGIFIGVISFLIIGLVNDSIVTVSPIFWILLGILLSRSNSHQYNNLSK